MTGWVASGRTNRWMNWGFAKLNAVGSMAHQPPLVSIQGREEMSPNKRVAASRELTARDLNEHPQDCRNRIIENGECRMARLEKD